MKFNLLSSSKIEASKRVLVILLFVATYLLHISCKDEKMPTETIDPRLAKVVGAYKATTYINHSDIYNIGDILKKGGAILVNVLPDSSVTGRIIIPQNLFPGSEGVDQTFKGRIKFLGNDSLKFVGTQNVLSISGFHFRIFTDSLVAKLQTIGYDAVTLTKLKKDIQY